jgi:glycosyltransferase involved in cell wall biosynthesis
VADDRSDRRSERQAGSPLTVVVCSRDRAMFLDSALTALRGALRAGDDVIVVDSASTDSSVADTARHHGARVLRCDRPGASLARNVGAALATAALLAFTDDDCRPEPGWADTIASAFADPVVGFVTGRVLPDAEEGAVVAVMTDANPARFEYPDDPAPVGHGANMAVRRVAFEAVGGFDELLGAGGRFRGAEDHDLFYRLLDAGWHGVYEPDAVVVHHQWRSQRQALRLEYGYGLGSGAFAVKVARVRGDAGRRMLARRLWDDGLLRAWRDLRSGYETGAASNLLRVAGVATGAARGMFTPLDGDRYSPPARDPDSDA